MAWTGKHGLRRSLAMVLLLSLCSAGGCLSRGAVQKQRFEVTLERESTAAGPGAGILRVSIVRAAPSFERKAFIYRRSDDTYVSDFYNEFFSAPGVMLRENLLRWLEASDIFEYVVAASDSNPDWILESRLEALYGDSRDANHLSTEARLRFTLLDATQPRRPIVFQQSYEARTEVAERKSDAYLRSVRVVLSEIFGKLEGDLRSAVEAHAESGAAPPPGEGEVDETRGGQ
ncbi:MAG: hypothetical protein JRG96_01035 [Deltaproteobacteria bacterium]|nr:hypothetical protein [Deltaproteobacteria bacterium]MBW2417346.1 hypothetical protein [Deltaproteobacteria bacterium]